MTDITQMFPTALRRETYTDDAKDDYESYLALIHQDDPEMLAEREPYFYIMGDLRGLCEMPEGDFEENEDGLFGNYIPEKHLIALLVKHEPELYSRIVLDPEGGTFFAYGSEEDLGKLMDFIGDHRDDFRA